MPPKRSVPTSSSSEMPILRQRKQARNLSPHERSDSSIEDEDESNETGVDVISTPAIPPLEATNSQLPTGEGAAMVLQSVHLIKGLNAGEIALLRANRQQFAAYNRTRDFPLHRSFPVEHMHEIGLVIASHERMWPEGIDPRFLDPINSDEDMSLLINLINDNENILLDVLRDQYLTEQDKKGGTDDFYLRAVNLEIPTTCLSKAEQSALYDFFGKVKQYQSQGNFTPNQESMVVKAYKRQIKSGNVYNDRLINDVFDNPKPTTINELQERYLNLLSIQDYKYVAFLKRCGYEVTVRGKRPFFSL